MPMGPVALGDEVGIDIAQEVAGVLHEAYGDRLPLPSWHRELPAAGYLGKKNGRGVYRWDDGERGAPDPAVYELLGLEPRDRGPGPALPRGADGAAR